MRLTTTTRIMPMAIVVGAIALLVSAPIAEASPRVRVRSGNSISIRTGNSSCSTPRRTTHRTYSNHRHNNRSHYNSHRRSYPKYRSGVSISIGGSYGTCTGYDYGYSYTTRPTYRPAPRATYNYYNYSSNCGTPVYRTSSGYSSYDRAPSYGTVYTTSQDRYRDWQRDTERTEVVTERPREPLLPQRDLSQYEREIQEAAALIRAEAQARVDRENTQREDEAQDDSEMVEYADNSEPPIGTGSTPTSSDREFEETEPDELAQAWNTLLDGETSTARALFADAARTMPTKGAARMGDVIASLGDSDRRAASVSMVRLLESEPQLVRGGALPESETLQDELGRIAQTLKAYRDESVLSYENRMLIAFVDLLRGETSEAQEAMRRSRSAGAEGIAARNLWRLVGLSDKPLERLTQH